MQISCSQCDFTAAIDAALLPVSGMEGLCPRCRSSIPLGGWQPAEPAAPATAQEIQPAALGVESGELPEEGSVSLINIIVLITLVDSTLSLIGRVPGLSGVLTGGTGLTFHQQAKYLYDTLMAAGFFVSVFGLMARKKWARLLIIWLFGLGLAEGLYMFVYQYFTIAELERNAQEGFPELKRQQNAKMLGCAVYAFFLYKLSTRTIKARFR